jgi:hypothetical protein
MGDEKSVVMAAVVDQLTQLRGRLDPSEQIVLDSIVMGQMPPEVSGHADTGDMQAPEGKSIALKGEEYQVVAF